MGGIGVSAELLHSMKVEEIWGAISRNIGSVLAKHWDRNWTRQTRAFEDPSMYESRFSGNTVSRIQRLPEHITLGVRSRVWAEAWRLAALCSRNQHHRALRIHYCSILAVCHPPQRPGSKTRQRPGLTLEKNGGSVCFEMLIARYAIAQCR